MSPRSDVVGAADAPNIVSVCFSWDMENIEAEAIPLQKQGAYLRTPVPYAGEMALPTPSESTRTFARVLQLRRSAKSFALLTDTSLSNFLHDVASLQQLNLSDCNRQMRYVASMGALHPTHLLICNPNNRWFVYLPEKHSLGVLVVDTSSAAAIRNLVNEHHSSQTATVLCLLSDCTLVENYYEHYASLLFKDAGVLLGHASLVAAAHNLAFRILGRNGIGCIDRLIPGLPFKPLPTGLALLGNGA